MSSPGGTVWTKIKPWSQVLMPKVVMVNRAPVMTAWATVVAERLGFKREEALSIGKLISRRNPAPHMTLTRKLPVASVYTEMNAASKGISLGIFDEAKNKDYVAGSAQPYVELMGRKWVSWLRFDNTLSDAVALPHPGCKRI
jgi:hypothetical protein